MRNDITIIIVQNVCACEFFISFAIQDEVDVSFHFIFILDSFIVKQQYENNVMTSFIYLQAIFFIRYFIYDCLPFQMHYLMPFIIHL